MQCEETSYQGRKVTSDTSDGSCRAAAAAASAPNTERHNGLLFTGFLPADVIGKAWPAIRTSGETCYQSGCLLICQTWSLLQWNCFIVYPTNQTLKGKCGRD